MQQLQSMSDPEVKAGQERAGINTAFAYGIKIPPLRQMAKDVGKDHDLAQQLWDSGIHEARILATMIDHPRWVTEDQMERWVADFNAWDLCDQCIGNLFDCTGELTCHKALEWSRRPEEFIKRAGFVLMARLAVGKKKGVTGDTFEAFWPIILEEATDERNFVKKAVNWALRQIGKYNLPLNQRAITIAHQMQQIDSQAARWIASDALRELTSEPIQQRLNDRAQS
ncbi:MAG: DNA alkylation repair protein [Anaerolineae bacterium]|nr:DNA alkylation repair protein [Anaerolineae bacterium]